MKLLSNIWFLMLLSAVSFLGVLFFLSQGAASKQPSLPETMHTKEVDGTAVAALWNTQTGYIEKIENELKDRLRDFDQRESKLDQMEERIKSEKLELERIQKDVALMRQSIDDMVLAIDAAKVKNLRSQSSVYSGMDPQSVVKVFNTMSDVEVAEILYFMKPDVQSGIFSAFIDSTEKPKEPGKLFGAEKVARLNELLRFVQPPEKKKKK